MAEVDAESLAQGVYERLSEDESLRGELTDEGFSPLLSWAANAAIAYAQNLQSDNAEKAMDAYAARLKTVIQAVVADAQAGKIDDPAALLGFLSTPSSAARQKLQALKLGDKADANAVQITEVLSEVLNDAPTQEPASNSSDPAPSASDPAKVASANPTKLSASPASSSGVTPSTPSTSASGATPSTQPASHSSDSQTEKSVENVKTAEKHPEPEKKEAAPKSEPVLEKKQAAPQSKAVDGKLAHPKPADKSTSKGKPQPGETRRHAD